MKRVNTFIDMDTKLVGGSEVREEGSETREENSSKRAGDKLEQEPSKKQKVDDDKETEELKQFKAILKTMFEDHLEDSVWKNQQGSKLIMSVKWSLSFLDWSRNSLRKAMYLNEVFESILLVIDEAFNEEMLGL
ncbi:hypothetical protein Tco_0914358 [Tanacetum coccineum]